MHTDAYAHARQVAVRRLGHSSTCRANRASTRVVGDAECKASAARRKGVAKVPPKKKAAKKAVKKAAKKASPKKKAARKK